MGKKTKIGKQRKDKYYQLAKETGFRSRAAFKLIQLNRKFEFLQKSRVCLDLCAAPGGWMQVARQNMPVSSIVVGVDLFPIKPIPGCISIVGDITTDKTRVAISKELQTWKVDIVLHDGAPNVGKNWLHDAYQQACLTLSSLKLATQFLRQGGWFITKVFRSKDYHPLIWVLKQLFKKVHATKPQASRTESAEIFVVCQYYIAPDKIDPKFMDSKYVFQELEIEPKNKLNVYHPETKKKAKAEGYPENDYTLHHKTSVSEFIYATNPIEVLQKSSEIIFDDPQLNNHSKTTTEIKECCKDIKVLGRKELRLLINWQKILHEEFVKKEEETVEQQPVEKTPVVEDEEEKVDTEIEKQIAELKSEELRELKRQRKKANKERKKLNDRLNLKMVLKGDSGPTMEGEDMFTLKQIRDDKQLSNIREQEPEMVAFDSDSEDDSKPKNKFERYSKDQTHLDGSGTFYKDSDSELEMESDESDDEKAPGELGLNDSDTDNEDEPINEDDEDHHPLITDLDNRDSKQKKTHKAELWFERDAFKNLLDENDEDYDLDHLVDEYKKKGADIIGENNKEAKVDNTKDDTDTDTDTDSDDEEELNNYMLPQNGTQNEKTANLGKRKLDEEALALGTVMVNSKKARRDLIDAGWNRYTFNDDNLPDWFVEDERKHLNRPSLAPPELVEQYKNASKEINTRPIKKVVEAKARKKKRAQKRLERAKKKAEAILAGGGVDGDTGDREKARQIKRLYRKAKEPKKEVAYVVSKKGMNSGKKATRPAGVKGPYRLVDPRLKKDVRAQRNKAKTKGRGGKRPGKANKSKSGRPGKSSGLPACRGAHKVSQRLSATDGTRGRCLARRPVIDAAVARKDKVNAAAYARTLEGGTRPPGADDQYALREPDAAAVGLDLSIAHPPSECCMPPSPPHPHSPPNAPTAESIPSECVTCPGRISH